MNNYDSFRKLVLPIKMKIHLAFTSSLNTLTICNLKSYWLAGDTYQRTTEIYHNYIPGTVEVVDFQLLN